MIKLEKISGRFGNGLVYHSFNKYIGNGPGEKFTGRNITFQVVQKHYVRDDYPFISFFRFENQIFTVVTNSEQFQLHSFVTKIIFCN